MALLSVHEFRARRQAGRRPAAAPRHVQSCHRGAGLQPHRGPDPAADPATASSTAGDRLPSEAGARGAVRTVKPGAVPRGLRGSRPTAVTHPPGRRRGWCVRDRSDQRAGRWGISDSSRSRVEHDVTELARCWSSALPAGVPARGRAGPSRISSRIWSTMRLETRPAVTRLNMSGERPPAAGRLTSGSKLMD